MEALARNASVQGRAREAQLWKTSLDFQQTTKIIIRGKFLVIPLIKTMFTKDATSFGELNFNDPLARWIITATQFWMHVIMVVYTRILASGIPVSRCPFEMFLETLCDDAGKPVEYRLWISDNGDNQFSLAKTYFQAAQSQKKEINADGEYIDVRTTQPQVATGNRRQGGGGAAAPAPAPAAPGPRMNAAAELVNNTNGNRIGKLELWRRVRSLHIVDEMSRCVANIKEDSARLKNLYEIYSIDTAMFRASPEVKNSQCNINTYRKRIEGTEQFEYHISHTLGLYRISHLYCSNLINHFFAKKFPHVQLNINDTIYHERIMTFARETDMIIRARDQATRQAQNIVNQGANPYDDDEEDPIAAAAAAEQQGAAAAAENPNDQYANDRNRDGEAFTHMRGDPGDIININVSEEQMQDALGLLDINPITDSEEDVHEDHISSLRTQLTSYMAIIDKRYRTELANFADDGITDLADHRIRKLTYRMNAEKNAARRHVAELYKRYCTASASEISRTMSLMYENANKDRLFNMIETGEAEVLITDPTMSAMANYTKWTVEGYHEYEDVTYHQTNCTLMHFGLTNMFNRHRGLHYNPLLTGDGGGGKSFMVKAVLQQFDPRICESLNSESRQSKFGDDMYVYDGLTYNDDGNFIGLAHSKDNEDGEIRALMTDNEIKRRVVEIDPTSGVRRQRTIHHVFIGCTINSTNTGEMDLIWNSPHGSEARILALLSRFTVININQVRDNANSIMTSSKGSLTSGKDAARARFRNINRLINLLIAQYWQQEFIGIAAAPDMGAFDIIFPRLISYLETQGIKHAHPRQIEKIKTWCQEYVIRRSIIETFFVSTGRHFKKEYFPYYMLDVVPVCIEDDVIAAFTFYFTNFYPRELNTVIRALREISTESLRAGDMLVRPANPYSNKNDHGENDRRGPATNDGGGGMGNIFTEIRNPHTNAVMQNAQASGVVTGPINIPSRKRKNDVALQEGNPGALEAMSDRPISFMQFNVDSKARFSSLIQEKTGTQQEKPSKASIDFCIDLLTRWLMPTASWAFDHRLRRYSLVEDSIVVNRSGIIFRDRAMYVNYCLLADDGKYDDLCFEAIRSIMFDTTYIRRVITGIQFDEFPWILRVIKMEPTSNKRYSINSKYVSPARQIILTGTDNPDLLEPDQRKQFSYMEMDIDSNMLMNFFERQPLVHEVTMDMITTFHPMRLLALNYKKAIRRAENNPQFRFSIYPDDMYAEAVRTRDLADKIHRNQFDHRLAVSHERTRQGVNVVMPQNPAEYMRRARRECGVLISNVPDLRKRSEIMGMIEEARERGEEMALDNSQLALVQLALPSMGGVLDTWDAMHMRMHEAVSSCRHADDPTDILIGVDEVQRDFEDMNDAAAGVGPNFDAGVEEVAQDNDDDLSQHERQERAEHAARNGLDDLADMLDGNEIPDELLAGF